MSPIANTFRRLLYAEDGFGRVWVGLAMAVCLAGGGLVYQQVENGGGAQACAAFPSFPDASCTGVPSGTSLTAYTGPTTITTNNTVIDSKDVTDCLTIQATGVVISNSYIHCDTGSFGYVVSVQDEDGAFDVTITDSELYCSANRGNSQGLGSAFITARRVDIHGCENGMDINQGVDIQDSYIHDLFQSSNGTLYPPDGTHTDGIQFGLGHFDPPGSPSPDDGVINVTIQHNTILSMCAGASTPESNADCYTTSAIIDHSFAQNTNITISQNLLAGGAFTLYCSIGFTGVNYHVDSNHFSTRYKSTVGYFGHSSDCSDESQSGNVIDETGDPITLD